MHICMFMQNFENVDFKTLFFLAAEIFVFTGLKGHTSLKVTVLIRSLGPKKDQP